MKRFERPMFEFLTREEMLAVISAPGTNWVSQRDKLLLALLYNTGARVSESIGVKVGDVVLAPAGAPVITVGVRTRRTAESRPRGRVVIAGYFSGFRGTHCA